MQIRRVRWLAAMAPPLPGGGGGPHHFYSLLPAMHFPAQPRSIVLYRSQTRKPMLLYSWTPCRLVPNSIVIDVARNLRPGGGALCLGSRILALFFSSLGSKSF